MSLEQKKALRQGGELFFVPEEFARNWGEIPFQAGRKGSIEKNLKADYTEVVKKKTLILFISLVSSLAFTGCLGIGEDSTNSGDTANANSHIYATAEFSIVMPNEWEAVLPPHLPSTVSPNIVAAFQSNVKNPRFTANMIVTKNLLSADIITLDYAKALHEKVRAELVSFAQVSKETVKIKIAGTETETLVTEVEGREAADADLKRFFIISGVKGKTAFVATGATLTDESEAARIHVAKMVRSFEIK